MKKVTTRLTVLAFALLSVTACSTMNKHKNTGNANGSAEVTDASDTTCSGLGSSSSFSGDCAGGKASKLQVGNQVYYFDFDRSDLRADDRQSAVVQARYLADHPNSKVVLEGNTDPRGSREYNIALGMRRALSVADVLKLEGASNNQIRTVSYGAEKLASQGTSDEDYQQDRRVELKYEDKG